MTGVYYKRTLSGPIGYRSLFVIFMLVFGVTVFSLLALEAYAQTTASSTLSQNRCDDYGPSQFPFSESAFDDFGVPYDIFHTQGSRIQLKVWCLQDRYSFAITPSEASADTNSTWVWKTAYVSRLTEDYVAHLRGGIGGLGFMDEKYQWESVSLEGSSTNGNWIPLSGSARIDQGNAAQFGEDTYFLGYMCQYQNGWRCGCRQAQTCTSNGKWQIQKVDR